ncbi:hypothetical protein K435DRAFT_792671 [Dendrothele bispora CBS 962.96]|uniref:Uncharacterized protein n=1 Tax=Dendrothele bispora (strain CBS 962.96) TaxID=1314807 RepID=A0A4S8MHY7_DENBC|nr:hypothetical protein K435DRAFT_792671 [Dendrothele bispora CBS 962.96]
MMKLALLLEEQEAAGAGAVMEHASMRQNVILFRTGRHHAHGSDRCCADDAGKVRYESNARILGNGVCLVEVGADEREATDKWDNLEEDGKEAEVEGDSEGAGGDGRRQLDNKLPELVTSEWIGFVQKGDRSTDATLRATSKHQAADPQTEIWDT